MTSSYSSILRQLYTININHPVKLGLQNMFRLNELLGDPLKGCEIIHIAGTNGKGSVATKIAKGLEVLGLKTGLFTSPHISSFRERIQINGQVMPRDDIEKMLPFLFDLCAHHDIPATFFEITTALAFLQFQREKCDAVVLEVGLGGRLDATNIVHPALSIITSIQMDHVQILGDRLDLIAREKAGIIKANTPVLVGPECVHEVIQEIAQNLNAPYHRIENVLTAQEVGYHQTDKGSDTDDLNQDLARAALKLLIQKGHLHTTLSELDSAAMVEALKKRPICRFESFLVSLQVEPKRGDNVEVAGDEQKLIPPIRVILDIAHNVDAMKALANRLDRYHGAGRKVRVVIGMSGDKDVPTCLPIVTRLVQNDPHRIYCTEARHPRALPCNDLRRMLVSTLSPGVDDSSREEEWRQYDSAAIPAALEHALSDALGISHDTSLKVCKSIPAAADSDKEVEKEEIVVVCGSAFLMAQTRSFLAIEEPHDEDDLKVERGNDNTKSGHDEEKQDTSNDQLSRYGDAQELFTSLSSTQKKSET
eukprot:gene4465-4891_t